MTTLSHSVTQSYARYQAKGVTPRSQAEAVSRQARRGAKRLLRVRGRRGRRRRHGEARREAWETITLLTHSFPGLLTPPEAGRSHDPTNPVQCEEEAVTAADDEKRHDA